MDGEATFGKPLRDFTDDDWRVAIDWYEEHGQPEAAALVRVYLALRESDAEPEDYEQIFKMF